MKMKTSTAVRLAGDEVKLAALLGVQLSTLIKRQRGYLRPKHVLLLRVARPEWFQPPQREAEPQHSLAKAA